MMASHTSQTVTVGLLQMQAQPEPEVNLERAVVQVRAAAAPGDLGFRSYPTRYGTLGVLICWDQWFPEAARLTALTGADILFYPSAIGWHQHERPEVAHAQHEAWELVQRSHAVTNGVYVAAVNRVGRENDVTFWGASFMAAPDRQLLARAALDAETTTLA